MSEEVWQLWRVTNLVVAALALLFGLGSFYVQRLWRHAGDAEFMGFLAIVAWCGCYMAATIVAAVQDPGAPPGPWTAIMSVPLGWSLALGVFLWRRG